MLVHENSGFSTFYFLFDDELSFYFTAYRYVGMKLFSGKVCVKYIEQHVMSGIFIIIRFFSNIKFAIIQVVTNVRNQIR